MSSLQEQFGPIDIYLFDQLLRGRIEPGMRILDAGCGGGRNIVWFMRNGFDVSAIDVDARIVGAVRDLADRVAPQLSPENLQVATLESIPYLERALPDA